MKTEILKERENETNLCDSIAKGALLWAPIYSVGATTAIHYLLSNETAETVSYSELLIKSLLVLSPICILTEVAGWLVVNWVPLLKRLGTRTAALPKLSHFVPPGEADHYRHRHA
ncbi:hypothetical protein P4B35_17075 [Pontiellaceae bacterium B12227]|nr:hypothetical protein [Pontiellaceae bacterium B12227]